MQDYFKVPSKRNSEAVLRIYPGHFVTPNSHINQYMDISPMKCRVSEA